MPIIKPISDLRNKSKEISRLTHKENEPIFITKNGEGDMVIMSMQRYRNMQKQLEIYRKLVEAETRKSSGEKAIDGKLVFKRLREKLNGKKQA
jgi:prevent-host-death family protein